MGDFLCPLQGNSKFLSLQCQHGDVDTINFDCNVADKYEIQRKSRRARLNGATRFFFERLQLTTRLYGNISQNTLILTWSLSALSCSFCYVVCEEEGYVFYNSRISACQNLPNTKSLYNSLKHMYGRLGLNSKVLQYMEKIKFPHQRFKCMVERMLTVSQVFLTLTAFHLDFQSAPLYIKNMLIAWNLCHITLHETRLNISPVLQRLIS